MTGWGWVGIIVGGALAGFATAIRAYAVGYRAGHRRACSAWEASVEKTRLLLILAAESHPAWPSSTVRLDKKDPPS